jgi:IPT/TIG domain/Subtilase family
MEGNSMRGPTSPSPALDARASTAFRPDRATTRARSLPAALTGALVLLALAFPGASVASPSAGPAARAGAKLHLHKPSLSAAGSSNKPHWACPEGACDAIVLSPSAKVAQGSGERKGLDPQDLQSAYKIPAKLESPQTVALVDAFGYPDAESDLAKYRERYGLPPCKKSNGCFKKVNEKGDEAKYPAEEEGWDVEAALDEDMVSAACPECHILLVEGSTELPEDLGESVNTAVELGANVVSNSYGYPELLKEYCGTKGCSQYNGDYEHPGVLILASAGDAGYADAYYGLRSTDFPAASPNVVAVGGTALFRDEGNPRGWFEEVWNEPFLEIGTGSGCTVDQTKPAWQTEKGCSKRIDNDIAAVAAVVTPVSLRIDGIWDLAGGTSVASPLVAGIEAYASAHERSLGAQAFYQDPSSLYDVTEGFDWNSLDASGTSECAANEYLCNAELGYDGPTGLGTPDGIPVEAGEPPTITKVSPKKGPAAGGTTVKVKGTNFTGATEVKFGGAEAKSFTVVSATSITAESPAGSGRVDVKVTTADGTSAISKADHFTYH